jgi:hypothetical protein
MIGFTDKRTQVKPKELMPGVIIVSREDLIRKNSRLNDRYDLFVVYSYFGLGLYSENTILILNCR